MKRSLFLRRSPQEIHGMSGTPEYTTWNGMKRRCNNPSEDSWAHYGGRGVKIYGPWKKSFIEFYNYIGPKPSPGHSIDRIDNDGHYEPGNVRWATKEQQLSNRSEYGVIVKVTVPLKKSEARYAYDYDFSRKLSRWRNLHSRVEEVGLLSKGRVFVLYKGSDKAWKKETIEMAGQIGEVVKDSGGPEGRWFVDFKPRKIWIKPEHLTLLPCVVGLRGPASQ